MFSVGPPSADYNHTGEIESDRGVASTIRSPFTNMFQNSMCLRQSLKPEYSNDTF